MIRSSFIFLERLGPGKEQKLWAQGILTWEDFLKAKKIHGISAAAKGHYDRKILEARRALSLDDSSYFCKVLPLSEQWRLYGCFKDEAVYLDIETDGINSNDDITVVGLFDGLNTKTMVRGRNLDFKVLQQELAKYKMIVTFNGSVFDLPFIRKRYGEVLPRVVQFDLRFCCRRIGLCLGLKEIERQLGIVRSNPIVAKLYGGDAALLHRMWRGSGDDDYLQLLVEYNEEDVINLKKIADYTYALLKGKTLKLQDYSDAKILIN